jgi:hypothetical protein
MWWAYTQGAYIRGAYSRRFTVYFPFNIPKILVNVGGGVVKFLERVKIFGKD